jgi:NAD(P)-dependent dehydrogenase (short-subunit alcohol dehydrogenase family)
MFDLTGKRAFITGGARGIGQATARRMAQAGATIGVSDLPGTDFSETVALVREQGQKCFTYEFDVRDFDCRKEEVDRALVEMGGIDIAMSNAGISFPSPGLTVQEDLWDRHFDINVKGSFFFVQQVVPQMIERGWGRVIFTASQAGIVAIPDQPAYNASKAAVVHLVRSLGVEWAKHGVTVNGIAPTFIRTHINSWRVDDDDYREYLLSMIPGGKLGEVDDIAYAAVYLASEEAKMCTCHTLRVDGGWTAW